MTDANELAAAVDRLRRVKAGENPADVYGTVRTLSHLGPHGLAMRRLNFDHHTLSDAYLALGTRQPVEQVTWNDDGTMTLVVCGHVEPVRNGDSIVYIQAEVPNAE